MSEQTSEQFDEGSIWEGKRVRLRAVEPTDWQSFFDWNQDSEAARGMYYIPFPGSQESVKRWAEKQATQEPDDDKFFFVVETLGGEIVGSLNAHSCEPHHGTFAYGIGIRRSHQHRGYASEAILLLLRYFFLELRYQKATVEVYSFNDPSVRLHERLGFQLEGRLRRMIFTRGRHFDKLVFGMTVEEFVAKHGAAFGLAEKEQ
jgi:RimJ/RimL family protein N-acetyltransferase